MKKDLSEVEGLILRKPTPEGECEFIRMRVFSRGGDLFVHMLAERLDLRPDVSLVDNTDLSNARIADLMYESTIF